jgi:hypothetical protein
VYIYIFNYRFCSNSKSTLLLSTVSLRDRLSGKSLSSQSCLRWSLIVVIFSIFLDILVCLLVHFKLIDSKIFRNLERKISVLALAEHVSHFKQEFLFSGSVLDLPVSLGILLVLWNLGLSLLIDSKLNLRRFNSWNKLSLPWADGAVIAFHSTIL